MNFHLNYWAILVAGLSNMVIGFIWYGPLLGKAWATEMGWKEKSAEEMALMKKKAMWMYPQQFIGALIMAFVFAHVFAAFWGASIERTLGNGLMGAFWMWLGFIAVLKYGDKLWGGKSIKLFFIDSGYWLVSLLAMGAILTCWK
jgi:hypothetical protein